MSIIGKMVIIIFGLFLIAAGFLMLLAPDKVRNIIRKAGSTMLINYGEITIRLVLAICLVLYADFSRFPFQFKMLGWFMLVTSIILYFVPRQVHHSFSVRSADILKPIILRFIAPVSFLSGAIVIYAVC
jgi:hypothetical protein